MGVLHWWRQKRFKWITHYCIAQSFCFVIFAFFEEKFCPDILKTEWYSSWKKRITSSQDHKFIIRSRDAASKVCKREQVFWFVSCNERRLSGCFCNTDFQGHYLYLVFATLGLIRLNGGVQTKKNHLWTSVCRFISEFTSDIKLIKGGHTPYGFQPVFGPIVEPQDSFWSWKAEFRLIEHHYLCSVQRGAREDYLISDTSQTLVDSGFWTVEAGPRPDSPMLNAFSPVASAPSDKQDV